MYERIKYIIIPLSIVFVAALAAAFILSGNWVLYKEPAYKRTTEYYVFIPDSRSYDYAITSETAIHNGNFTLVEDGYYNAFVIVNKSDKREVVVSKILSECNRKTRRGIDDNGCIDGFIKIYNSIQPQ